MVDWACVSGMASDEGDSYYSEHEIVTHDYVDAPTKKGGRKMSETTEDYDYYDPDYHAEEAKYVSQELALTEFIDTKMWKTKSGEKIAVADLGDNHLINIIKMFIDGRIFGHVAGAQVWNDARGILGNELYKRNELHRRTENK